MVKHLLTMQETQVQSLGGEDPLEKEMATHSSILAWKIPWTEEPGGLQSMGSQRVRHCWVTSLSLSLGWAVRTDSAGAQLHVCGSRRRCPPQGPFPGLALMEGVRSESLPKGWTQGTKAGNQALYSS